MKIHGLEWLFAAIAAVGVGCSWGMCLMIIGSGLFTGHTAILIHAAAILSITVLYRRYLMTVVGNIVMRAANYVVLGLVDDCFKVIDDKNKLKERLRRLESYASGETLSEEQG